MNEASIAEIDSGEEPEALVRADFQLAPLLRNGECLRYNWDRPTLCRAYLLSRTAIAASEVIHAWVCVIGELHTTGLWAEWNYVEKRWYRCEALLARIPLDMLKMALGEIGR